MKKQYWEKKGLIFDCEKLLPKWMYSHASLPIAEHLTGDIYRIYFSGRDRLSRSLMGWFDIDISSPHHILRVSRRPILEPGNPGIFDDSGAMGSWIVKYQKKKYLYYIGWNLGVNVPFRNSIGLAIYDECTKTFQKYSNGPIIDRNPIDPIFTASCCILPKKNRWLMWYLSCVNWEVKRMLPKHYYHIRFATSKDGISWNRQGKVCIDFQSKAEYAISRPSVLLEGKVYKMWYSYRGKSYRIGYAESLDGVRWKRMDDLVRLDVSKRGWDSEMIEYPFVFVHKGAKYMLYNGNGYGKTGIGLATLKN